MNGARERLHQRRGVLVGPRRGGSLFREAATWQVFEREEGPAVAFADFMDLHDVRVLHACNGFRLGPKTGPYRGVRIGTRKNHLECDQSIERSLTREVDDSHTPA